MSEKSDRPTNDHFAWLDDVVRRWPIVMVAFGTIAWVSRMQISQTAQAEELRRITVQFPEVALKLDRVDQKLDAMLDTLGYEVKLKAVKKYANIQPN